MRLTIFYAHALSRSRAVSVIPIALIRRPEMSVVMCNAVFRISFLTAAATTASRNRARYIRDRELLRLQCASVGSGMLHLLSRVVLARGEIFMRNRNRAPFSFRAHTIGLQTLSVEQANAREIRINADWTFFVFFFFFNFPIYSLHKFFDIS